MHMRRKNNKNNKNSQLLKKYLYFLSNLLKIDMLSFAYFHNCLVRIGPSVLSRMETQYYFSC